MNNSFSLRSQRNKTYYLVWLLICVMYGPVFFLLYQIRWKLIDYSHAYFILPISLLMIWKKKDRLIKYYEEFRPKGADVVGLAIAFVGMMMFLFGWIQDYLIISTLSFIPVTWGGVRFLYGKAIAREVSLPILYLLLLVPPPLGVLDSVTLPMRYGVAHITEVILGAFHYPISRSGLLLNMGGNEIYMGAPCSGFRSLVTVLALTIAYVSFGAGSLRNKLIIVVSGIPFAMIGNLLRVIGLCLVTHYVGKEAAEGFFHELSGILIFIFVVLSVMCLDRYLESQSRK